MPTSYLIFPLVLGFFLQQLEGDLETLAIVTYSLTSISLLCLLLTFFFLICLKGLKSNTRGIHCNISVTLFFSELLFLFGINRTEHQVRWNKEEKQEPWGVTSWEANGSFIGWKTIGLRRPHLPELEK